MMVLPTHIEKLEKASLEKLQSLTAKATALVIASEFTQSTGAPGKLIVTLPKQSLFS